MSQCNSGGCGGSRRENYTPMMPGDNGQMMGGRMMCQFAAPAPRRIYCRAAPFATVNGNPYQPILVAYGQSTAAGY